LFDVSTGWVFGARPWPTYITFFPAGKKWPLLNFIVDPRTGLEGIFGFSIPHNALLYKLMTYCRHNPIEEILGLPDVVERVNAYQY